MSHSARRAFGLLVLVLFVFAALTLSYTGTSSAITGSGVDILYAPSQNDDAGFRASIAAITGGAVDYFDSSAATPTLAELQNYDCVFVWTDFSHADATLFGDRLADYVDGGGVVALGAFAAYTSGNSLGGRIMTAGYSPVSGGSNYFAAADYAGDGTTLIHDEVTAYNCTYRDILTLQGSGVQDGTYTDGSIATAYRPDFQVIYLNGVSHLACTGDVAQLVANACSIATYDAPAGEADVYQPSPEDHARAQAPLCADLTGTTNPIVRADVPGGTVTNGGVYCRVLAEDGDFVNSAAEVGNETLVGAGVIHAVDVFGMAGTLSVPAFNSSVEVCLQGSGTLWFLSALDAPRSLQALPATATGGYTCARIPHAGTVVLTP